jgi:hypothetical protein
MTDILFDFTWHRDPKGYRLVHFNFLNLAWQLPEDDPVRYIVPNGPIEGLKTYQPFARGGDLCRVFAEIRTPDELLRFVNTYGPLEEYYFRARGKDWEYGEKNGSLDNDPRLNPILFSTGGFTAEWITKDGRCVPADFIPGDTVPECLQAADIFRRLLKLKERNKLKEIASFFNSDRVVPVVCRWTNKVDIVADPRRGVRVRLTPPTLISALWYQLGLKLSGETNIKTCSYCKKFFETGRGTGLRADAKFCSTDHKVKYFNRRRGRTRKG